MPGVPVVNHPINHSATALTKAPNSHRWYLNVSVPDPWVCVLANRPGTPTMVNAMGHISRSKVARIS